MDVSKTNSSFKFYKNPVFILVSVYTLVISILYYSLPDYTKNSYVFNNIFRDETGIYWKYIITYPYDYEKHKGLGKLNILKSPIILYLIFSILLLLPLIEPDTRKSNQAFFYSIMFSYFILGILFIIHWFILSYISNPEDVDIEIPLGDIDEIKKTYSTFYRTQWVLLGWLAPIYTAGLVYVYRYTNIDN
jgi:hypothetical protein